MLKNPLISRNLQRCKEYFRICFYCNDCWGRDRTRGSSLHNNKQTPSWFKKILLLKLCLYGTIEMSQINIHNPHLLFHWHVTDANLLWKWCQEHHSPPSSVDCREQTWFGSGLGVFFPPKLQFYWTAKEFSLIFCRFSLVSLKNHSTEPVHSEDSGCRNSVRAIKHSPALTNSHQSFPLSQTGKSDEPHSVAWHCKSFSVHHPRIQISLYKPIYSLVRAERSDLTSCRVHPHLIFSSKMVPILPGENTLAKEVTHLESIQQFSCTLCFSTFSLTLFGAFM